MDVNTVDIQILGIQPYFFFACIAVAAAVCCFTFLLVLKDYRIEPHLEALGISLLGLMLGARLFGCLSGIYRAIGKEETLTMDTVLQTGIVFYGGLFGLLAVYHVLANRPEKVRSPETMDLLIVTVPLFHTIARVGCFFGGCCFGIPWKGVFAICYTTRNMSAVVTEYRFPVQLAEALFNLILFVYLVILVSRRDWKEKSLTRRYLWIYSTGRFLLEFFRGDAVRGIVGNLSFGQMISLLVWIGLTGSGIHQKIILKREC